MAEVKKNVVAPAATEVKKEEVKKEAPKAEVKKEAPKKEAPKKAEAKKAPAKKEAPKKAAAKKAPAKKAEVKETFAVQFAGKDYASDVIVKLVKDAYKATKNKAAIKTLNVYVNTDDSRAYYVINDEFHGSVEL
jgi:glucan-binding YG repeat protein